MGVLLWALHIVHERVYSNQGNPPLIDLLDKGCNRLLDVGCGAGNNAALVKSRYPECNVFGITYSTAEAKLADKYMVKCWIHDIEHDLPEDLSSQEFDVVIFSHILEHLRDPAVVLARFSNLLRNGGLVLIAVPNVLFWRMRVQFLMGNFEYESAGILDDTHLRFFTFLTAGKLLLAKAKDLELVREKVTGSVPLWCLRRYLIPRSWSERIDRLGCRFWPNLFGDQVLLKAIKK